MAAAYARYGKACPRFFGGPVPSHIGHHLGSGRLPTGAKLTQPTYIGAQGLRLGPTLRGDGSVAAAPTSTTARACSSAGAGAAPLRRDGHPSYRVGPTAWTLTHVGCPGRTRAISARRWQPNPEAYSPEDPYTTVALLV